VLVDRDTGYADLIDRCHLALRSASHRIRVPILA
jgi:hypothetical protein